MSNDRKPIAKLTLRKDNVTHSILTIWPGKFPGTYDISRDKERTNNSGKVFPAMGLFDALKAWGLGQGYLSISVESEREGASKPAQRVSNTDDFGVADDLPF